MTLVKAKKRPAGQTIVRSNNTPQEVKQYNNRVRYVQGQIVSIPSSSSIDFEVNLLSSGSALLGFSVIPEAGFDITSSQLTLTVNSNVVVATGGLSNLNPNFVGNMMFFPVPQPLTGKDVIKGTIKNNAATTGGIIFNTFYVSALK